MYDIGRYHLRVSEATASHQPPETPRRGSSDDCNSGRLDAGVVLRLHDGSKVLRSPPWDLHGCKAADEIAFFSLSLSLLGLLMLRLRELPVGSRLVGLYWPTSGRIYASFMPGERGNNEFARFISTSVASSHFHLLIFVLTRRSPCLNLNRAALEEILQVQLLNSQNRTQRFDRCRLHRFRRQLRFYLMKNIARGRSARGVKAHSGNSYHSIFVRSNSSRTSLQFPLPLPSPSDFVSVLSRGVHLFRLMKIVSLTNRSRINGCQMC